MHFQFENFFSEHEILKVLCHIRAKMAKKRHDIHFLDNISNDNRLQYKDEIYNYFPPRRSWVRLSKIDRKSGLKSSLEINEQQLLYTIKKHKRKYSNNSDQKPNWLIELDKLLTKIRFIALKDETYQFEKPKIIPTPKDKTKTQFRPIAKYAFIDQIIIKQLSKYLIFQFDLYFSDQSFAFRKNQLHKKRSKKFDHHEAFLEIIKFWKSNNQQSLYVAESDLEKFYDTINHSIIINKYNEFSKKHKIDISDRATNLFLNYLKSYTFNKFVLDKSKNPHEDNIIFPWPKKQLQIYYNDINIENIGVPQGGAISVFIANLVLHYADKEISKYNKIFPVFYARFCDDIIILHKWKWRTKFALSVYNRSIKKLKLVFHKPQPLTVYNKDFWEIKSKLPYKWGNTLKNGFPWLSFVGYQLHSSGIIRIRRKSFIKERDKIIEETNKVLKHIKSTKNSIKISGHAIIFRLRQKLISMSVGRINILSKVNSNNFSWADGFKVLKISGLRIQTLQLKILDKTRNKSLAIVKRKLSNLNKEKSKSSLEINYIDYYGKPFSYFGQFENSETADNSD